jgi:hypothetical protein
VLETHPAELKKERFIKMLRNGSESKTGQHPKVGKAKGKAKEKERRVATVIAMPNLCATIGARGMGTATMPPPATSRTMVLKEVPKEKGKGQHRYRRKPLRKQRKKSWQW